MNEQKPNPGEGWRLLAPTETTVIGDEYLHNPPSDWRKSGIIGEIDKHDIYRRRIPAPADGWLDLKTVKPDRSQPIWIGTPDKQINWMPCSDSINLLKCGWTHWQPAIVPDPPKAPEPVKSAEEVGFEQALKLLVIDKHGAAAKWLKDGWDAALYWRKANP